MSLQDTQAAISAAVTPVVMISANAILISAISSKHQSMSDRLRALTAEWRNAATPVTPVTRREAIAGQLRLFDEQLRWVTWSHIVLYTATACFIAMVIVIAVSPALEAMSGASLGLLIAGVALMFLGILLELLDLAKARATVGLGVKEQPNARQPYLPAHDSKISLRVPRLQRLAASRSKRRGCSCLVHTGTGPCATRR
jgi:hypothetical protein